MAYTVTISAAAARQIRKFDRQFHVQIRDAIQSLENNPRCHGVIKLKGCEQYRFRSGNYRIIFEIHDAKLIVLIVSVSDRKDAYG